jgi:tRNA-splicing ligase RtcB (3'-phosphate/5'-hydroxy nucleic acid ligase)
MAIKLMGACGTAIIHADVIEQEAIRQVIELLDQAWAEGSNVRIMPDCHSGKGCVIGYTARLGDKVVPNLIGVDIGCGVRAWNLGPRSLSAVDFERLDAFVRDRIPCGMGGIHPQPVAACDADVDSICQRTRNRKRKDFTGYVRRSVGTLGGGNHFIEIDLDDTGRGWLVIHSGSRNFGSRIAEYHQGVAGRNVIGRPTGLEYLEGDARQEYLDDMKAAQRYASLNRAAMGRIILGDFFGLDAGAVASIESVHNFISFEDGIVRKGAISAKAGEKVIIPLNMADGIVVGTGRGNPEWNCSAPHGAGRRLSRTAAKATISLEEFERVMKENGVWTSTANRTTLDEAPQAYKDSDTIVGSLADTVDIEVRMKPVYNFKAAQ